MITPQNNAACNVDELAEILAAKAHVLSDIIQTVLNNKTDVSNQSLEQHFESIRNHTIPDIDIPTFSDVYAQTLAYGMFVARNHHKGASVFTRLVAVESIPKSHPFLRKFFGYIASSELDERIRWVVDELADVLQAANLNIIMQDFGKSTQTEDPTIHFYEHFLAAYNPELRKDIGAFYTPLPAVQYIIQAIDTLLKEEFDCRNGIADNTTIPYDIKVQDKTQRVNVHRVQILDPATGTGTFLAEIVKHIHSSVVSQGKAGAWNSYVAGDLLPRLHGFEILMAPYAMAHLKLDTLLEQSGYRFENDQRLGIYLTNALDEGIKKIERLPFATWLSDEAEGANRVKKNTPVMVVVGNPPYNNFRGVVAHYNETVYARTLIKKYKTGLTYQKLNLDDDYIKFIALGQNFIEKNPSSSGILAYISNNSFLDGITHRQMRKTLLETFDKIYIVNLHGNTRKRETSPDGSKDENIFNIMQGNSINIFVKKPAGVRKIRQTKLAKVYYIDIYGKRQDKYDFLSKIRLKKTGFEQLEPKEPYYFFVPKDFRRQKKYQKGFSVGELFIQYATGVKTERDPITIHFTRDELKRVVRDFVEWDKDAIAYKYDLRDSRDWSIARAKQDVQSHYDWTAYIKEMAYRPFDVRYIYYTGTSKGFIGTPGTKIAQHFYQENIALLTTRHFPTNQPFNRVFVTKHISDIHTISDQTIVFPLYTYSLDTKTPNLNQTIVTKIEHHIGKKIKPEKLFDYIYAILHSPKYRKDYEEFLKIDFPRVPYPESAEEFERFAKFGTKLRQLHLMEKKSKRKTTFPIADGNEVQEIRYTNNRVYINKTQYFDNVSESTWQFYVGGYQPLQKYLKDRKGRVLTFEEIVHYQDVVTAIDETQAVMKEME